jgi:transposase InsO family protein
MSMQRPTRRTNGHSKSLRNRTAVQALFIAWYNFRRKHEALKGNTPAMASKLTDHVWTIKELIEKAAS